MNEMKIRSKGYKTYKEGLCRFIWQIRQFGWAHWPVLFSKKRGSRSFFGFLCALQNTSGRKRLLRMVNRTGGRRMARLTGSQLTEVSMSALPLWDFIKLYSELLAFVSYSVEGGNNHAHPRFYMSSLHDWCYHVFSDLPCWYSHLP
jgi:hypothetical protein